METTHRYGDLSQHRISAHVIKAMPRSLVEKYVIVPIAEEEGVLIIASTKPDNLDMKDNIEQSLDRQVAFIQAELTEIQRLILTHYGGQASFETILENIQQEEVEELSQVREIRSLNKLALVTKEETTVVEIFDYIVNQAILEQASDIHIEPTQFETMVRVRIDGVLHELIKIPRILHKSLLSAIKVDSKLDITESRLPQDGELEIDWNGKHYDLRVATSLTIYGEKVGIRILSKDTLDLGLGKLGFEPENLELAREISEKPSGMILIVGPTGSGKTTTLFSMLSEMRSITKNIITIEDPVEYRLSLVNQMEVNNKVGLDFARASRSLLRQDPDIILMGEIRDKETATIAVQSSLAGTLLLSTLHSNDAIMTIDRLVNIGVDRFWVATTLNGVIAQRLVRRICPHCKVPDDPSLELRKRLGIDSKKKLYKGEGCEVCRQSGYFGRTVISEVLIVTEAFREGVYNHQSPIELRKLAIEQGFRPFLYEANKKVSQGKTTIEEILRVLAIDVSDENNLSL